MTVTYSTFLFVLQHYFYFSALISQCAQKVKWWLASTVCLPSMVDTYGWRLKGLSFTTRATYSLSASSVSTMCWGKLCRTTTTTTHLNPSAGRSALIRGVFEGSIYPMVLRLNQFSHVCSSLFTDVKRSWRIWHHCSHTSCWNTL